MKRYWLAALLVLVALAAILTGCGKKNQNNPDGEPSIQPQVQEDPDTVVCYNGSTTLRFHKEDDRWVWADDVHFPLDQDVVQSLLDTLDSLRELTPVSHAEALADYGLEGAKAYVMLSDKNDNASYVYLGNATDGGYYMFDGVEEDGIYVAPATLMEQICGNIYDMALLPSLPQLTMNDITSLDMVSSSRELHLTVKDGAWFSDNADVSDKMTAMTDVLGKLELAQCVDFRPASGAAGICGLTDSATTFTIGYSGDKTLTLVLGAAHKDSGNYVTVNEDTTIYLLSAELAAPFTALANNGL